ncbi:ketose-bisphosphate aldolase [Tepidanaerobacter sp. GT38]|uniref:ketose-bisphosphate aldolase n=1 Tax=Tepidanaerobacter sp. GT38 TaxID=2722793 RepID=UPI001F02745B|nr:ketose-bisphosphate aldolase [Tepidanaerobacter sp. GT38]MCG1012879.1 ketose-bisphosphate aldolase [Tepidanaerobacter sp. GT38]
MPLVKMKDLLTEVKQKKLILGSFNTSNLEITLSIIKGACEVEYPVIIQISPPSLKLSGSEYIFNIVNMAAKNTNVPISLHLDHGRTMEDIKNAIDNGFSSVMIDGSHLSYEENIELTKHVTSYCHNLGITVEAELGILKGKEDSEEIVEQDLTDPDAVENFCSKTKCDLLAISIGNIHGLQKKAEIDIDLLNKIHKSTDIPLVIHGGSGLPDEVLKKFKQYGIKKVNFSSELKRCFIKTIGERYIKNNLEFDLIHVLQEAKQNIENIVKQKLIALNT